MRGWAVSDAGLASGTTGLELVGASGDLDLVSAPGVAVLGVWDSGPGVAVLPVWQCLGLELGAGLGARRKSEHRRQSSHAQEMPMSQDR